MVKRSKKYDVNVLVPDTSVIIQGIVSDYIKKGIIKAKKVIINEAVLSELEYQANSGRIIGENGLNEVKKIRKIAKVEFLGRKPLPHEVKNAKKGGEIDALIRQIAFEENGTLITADKVQSMVAEAKGIKCIFVECAKKIQGFEITKLFNKNVHRVCLREGEKGVFVKLSKGRYISERQRKVWKKEGIEGIFEQSLEELSKVEDGFIEVNKKGLCVLRFKDYRIMMTSKPVANKTELIAVKKEKAKKIYDYKINVKYLNEVINSKAIFVVGEDSGEKVLCDSLLSYFNEKKEVCSFVDDFDVLLGDEIMQYKRNADNLELIKKSGKDYVYVGKLAEEDDGLLVNWFNQQDIKIICFLNSSRLSECMEKIVNLCGARVIEKAIIIKTENNKIKKIYKTSNTEVVDLFKDKSVLRIEND